MTLQTITYAQFHTTYRRSLVLRHVDNCELCVVRATQHRKPKQLWLHIADRSTSFEHPFARAICTLANSPSKYIIPIHYQCITPIGIGFILDMCDLDAYKYLPLLKFLDRIDYLQQHCHLELTTLGAWIYLIETWILQLTELWLDLRRCNNTHLFSADRIWIRDGALCLTPFGFSPSALKVCDLISRLESYTGVVLDTGLTMRTIDIICMMNLTYRSHRINQLGAHASFMKTPFRSDTGVVAELINKQTLTITDVQHIFRPACNLGTVLHRLLHDDVDQFNQLAVKITPIVITLVDIGNIIATFLYILEHECSFYKGAIEQHYAHLDNATAEHGHDEQTQANINQITVYLTQFATRVIRALGDHPDMT